MSFASGVRIGRYEIGQKLGQGGFGILFTARDTELGRDIAIKFLRPEHAFRPQVVQRFLQEARAAARISHPGIVTVYDSGEVSGTGTRADGTVFIAMELLAGATLANRLQRGGRMPYGMAIGFCRQIAAALAAAHQAGIVHRDLKPQNIFIVPDPAVVGGERVKILDFGIAKLADDMGSAINTHSMLMLGTPMYMSPEQCKSSAKVDARSDIYALGCMLFEMLCGQPPFGGDSGELIAKHQLVSPPTPRSLNPELPPVLDQIVTAMLAKNPDERPQTMAAVLDVLEDVGSETAIEPPTIPEGSPYVEREPAATVSEASRAPRWLRGRRGVVAGALAAVAVGISVGLLTMCGDKPTPRAATPVAVVTPIDAAPRDDIELERRKNTCLLAQIEKRWTDLAACAELLAPLDEASATAFAQVASLERDNELSIGRLEQALEAKSLDAAKQALDEIEETSTYHRLAQSLYTYAAGPRVALVAPTEPASDPRKCDAEGLRDQGIADVQRKQHKAALAKFRASLRCASDQYVTKLAFVAACNARDTDKAREYYSRMTQPQRDETRNVCEQNKIALGEAAQKCDADRFKEKGMENINLGQHAAALALFEASLRCKPDSYVVQLAFMSACSSANAKKAQSYYEQMTAASRTKFKPICERQKVPLHEPDACDADALKDEGMDRINLGQHDAALGKFEASLRCKRDSYVLQLAFMEACSAGNSAKAKYYYPQLTAAQQSKFAQICIRQKVPYE